MKTATASFKSALQSPLFFGKPVLEKKESKETHDQFEERTWKQKIHADDDGSIFIPPFALKNGLESVGKWLSMPIPGEGKKTFTKRFVSGTLVVDRMMLKDHDDKQLTIDDVVGQPLFVPSDGKRGGPKRVMRTFPVVEKWMTEATIHIMDDKIDEAVLAEHLKAFGMFIGFGSMRVENGGINGRFTVESLKLAEMKQAA